MTRGKYKGEKLDFVVELLKNDTKLSIIEAVRVMCRHFNIQYNENIRKGINGLLVKKREEGDEDLEESINFLKAKEKTVDRNKNVFIITWAQNTTPIHEGFFENILAYTEYMNAGLHVIAGRYKNPTSIFADKDQDWWSEDVTEYLDANRHNLHKYLQVLSDVKVSPTAATPLSGMNGITGVESCIIGHPRQHLKSLPVLEGYPHKLLLSTGACTLPNYTDSKSGKKGEFHHMLGFIIVELDGGDFHVRQVNADDSGNFYDIHGRAKNGRIEALDENIEIEAAILGDIHVRHSDKKVTKVVFDLLDKLKPKKTIIHDISEMESILHWDEKDPFRLLQKEEAGTDNLEKEIQEVIDWVGNHLKYNLVVARSNHDDMLDRWLKSTDWRKSPNKKMYLKLSNILAENEEVYKKGILPYLIEKAYPECLITLSLDDSFRVCGWELAMHGHLGANGSRGGHVQFKNLNTKNIVGHGHHPHREDGHIMVGTLSHLRVGFNRGPSSWMNGLCVIYPDSKAQLIHIINGKYCR